jgi:tetratricopeptide (TPR) repeat protein
MTVGMIPLTKRITKMEERRESSAGVIGDRAATRLGVDSSAGIRIPSRRLTERMSGAPRLRLSLPAPILGLCVAACLAAQEPVHPDPNRPVSSPGNAIWASDSDAARKLAAGQDKFVFLEFDGGPECGQCRRMDSLLYPAFDFEALLIPMVPAKVLLDSPEGKELARRYSIQQAPAVLIATPEGRLAFLMQGFASAPEFYRQVHADLATYRKFARQVEAQDIANLSPQEALETGLELFQRCDPGAAQPRLKRAVSAPKATPLVRDEAREQLAAVQLELGQTADARATTEALLKSTRDPGRRERAEIFRAQLPLYEGKPELAVKLLQKFVADHPKSAHAKQVQQIIDQLTGAPKSS